MTTLSLEQRVSFCLSECSQSSSRIHFVVQHIFDKQCVIHVSHTPTLAFILEAITRLDTISHEAIHPSRMKNERRGRCASNKGQTQVSVAHL